MMVGMDAEISTNGIKMTSYVTVSKEVLDSAPTISPLSFGFRSLTPEEQAEMRAAEAARIQGRIAFRDTLSHISEPLAQAILDHHQADDIEDDYACCVGCDGGGGDGEPARWPCSTTLLIAERFDIAQP